MSIYDYYNTRLSPQLEIMFQVDKYNSPFRNDSGWDYDHRGYWLENLGYNQSSNGHLTDKYKKPNHITFSNESRFYNGQPWAINWRSEPYNTLARLGIL